MPFNELAQKIETSDHAIILDYEPGYSNRCTHCNHLDSRGGYHRGTGWGKFHPVRTEIALFSQAPSIDLAGLEAALNCINPRRDCCDHQSLCRTSGLSLFSTVPHHHHHAHHHRNADDYHHPIHHHHANDNEHALDHRHTLHANRH